MQRQNTAGWKGRFTSLFIGTAAFLVCFTVLSQASPWAEVGDVQLRSDLDVLAAEGLVDDITMQWPIPWAGLLDRLNDLNSRATMQGEPLYLRDMARRVEAKASQQLDTHGAHFFSSFDLTNVSDVIRGFDAMGRQHVQAQLGGELIGEETAVRLSVGVRALDSKDRQRLVLDDSYAAERVGNALVYAGYLTHWWGPGWVSALSLSNNARPIPQIGLQRIDSAPFTSRWLRWMGPWQAEAFLGVLDGPRQDGNTLYDGGRFTINPIKGLEFALSRTDEFCGQGHACVFGGSSISNSETEFDARYTHTLLRIPFEIYGAAMNEANNPFVHSATSHQIGASSWFALRPGMLRLTAEYTDSVPTRNLFSFGDNDYGQAYNDAIYRDGMRYRGRTLGFSLDSDSRLTSLEASLVDNRGVTYGLDLHHARISDVQNVSGNVVTAAPVPLNEAEASIKVPLSRAELGLAVRAEDNQPRPKHGFAAAAEISLKVTL